MELLTPVAERPKTTARLAPRLDDLTGKTVGFIDNGWWSMRLLFDMLEVDLKERHGVARVIRQDKSKSSPVPRPQLEALAKECDAVVTALGN